MDIIVDCPLGSQCEYIGDDKKLHRCAWYTKLVGKNPQSEEQIDEWQCAMSWLPLMLVENAQTNRGQTAAIHQGNKETISRQEELNTILGMALNQSKQRMLNGSS